MVCGFFLLRRLREHDLGGVVVNQHPLAGNASELEESTIYRIYLRGIELAYYRAGFLRDQNTARKRAGAIATGNYRLDVHV